MTVVAITNRRLTATFTRLDMTNITIPMQSATRSTMREISGPRLYLLSLHSC